MAQALLVSDTSVPRYGVTGAELGTPRPFITVDGNAASGARHALQGANAITEQTRLDFSSLDDVRTLVVTSDVAHAMQPYVTYVTINAVDDVDAATRLNNGFPDVVAIPSGQSREINVDGAITSAHIIALPAMNTTYTSVRGRIWVEGRSHAQ